MAAKCLSLPVNLRVQERLCVLVGGGCVALRKGRKLAEHGARLRVVAPAPAAGWDRVPDNERIEMRRRPFTPADLEGAFLVIAASSDRALNREVASLALAQGKLVLVADDPEAGDVTFPATLRQGDLLVSFATEGAAPALAKRLKNEAAERYGPAHAEFCDLARQLRDGAAADLPDDRRTDFFRALVDSPVLQLLADHRAEAAQRCADELLERHRANGFSYPAHAPKCHTVCHGDPAACCHPGGPRGAGCGVSELGRQPERSERGTSREAGGKNGVRSALPPLSELGPWDRGWSREDDRPPRPADPRAPAARDRAPRCGRVYLIGSGPGDPGLLTVKGAECLRHADAILFDSIVNPLILHAHRDRAEFFDVGKRKGGCKRSQDETVALMVDLARRGRVVARLKGGDPMIFGRGGEEARALHHAGVPFEIIPGVSCVSAVPAYAGIPVTDREYASSVGVYTAHRRGGLDLSDEEWRRIAQGPDTLVFLMGKTRAGQLVERLMAFGRPPSTPIALICDGTLPHQRRTVATLQTFAVEEDDESAGPGMIVVGEVVNAWSEMDWFQTRSQFQTRSHGEDVEHGAHSTVRGR